MNIDISKVKIKMAEKLIGVSDLARLTGLSEYAVSRTINGKSNPNTKTVGLIAQGLECQVTDIVKSEEQ